MKAITFPLVIILFVVVMINTSYSQTTFEAKGLEITINSSGAWYSDNEFITPKNGFIYYTLNVTILNISNETKNVNPLYFSLIDGEGYKYDISFMGKEPNLGYGNLSPSDKMRGYITFEILKGATDLKIQYNSLF
ncbi:MAG: DUF4352 domain-containing protein [Ignavibacteriae bacterium]|nr:DUF4352 domain-containing protein [Ignavibacteriota bacterium]